MRHTYPSKINPGIFTIVVAAMVVPLILIIKKGDFNALIVWTPITAIVLSIFFWTRYTLTSQNTLIVVSGIIYRKTIDINTITSLRFTRNPISSPALSLDRIEIEFDKLSHIIISPKNKTQFVEELMKMNGSISLVK